MKKVYLLSLAVISLSLNAIAQNCMPTLLAHWNFDNGSTTDAVNGWVSTVAGTVTPTVGKSGANNTAMKFENGGYLRIASKPSMNLTSWTLSAIVRPDSFNNAMCQTNSIFFRSALYGNQFIGMSFTDNAYDNSCTGYNPQKNVFSGGAAGSIPPNQSWLGTNPFIVKGAWYCVTVTYDASTGKMNLFVDGTLVKAQNWPNYYQYTSNFAADIIIGASDAPNSAWPYFFNGAIDDLKLYTSAMCADSVKCKSSNPVDPPTDTTRTDTTTSISRYEIESHVQISPNPANNNIFIAMPGIWQSVTYTITNTTGALLKQGHTTEGSPIDIADLPAGFYIVTIKHEHTSITRKLLIQR